MKTKFTIKFNRELLIYNNGVYEYSSPLEVDEFVLGMLENKASKQDVANYLYEQVLEHLKPCIDLYLPENIYKTNN